MCKIKANFKDAVVKLFTPLAFLRKHKHNKTRRPE